MLFTAFPHPDDSASPDVLPRSTAPVNEELRVAQQASLAMVAAMRAGASSRVSRFAADRRAPGSWPLPARASELQRALGWQHQEPFARDRLLRRSVQRSAF